MKPLTPERFADLETIFNSTGCSIARGCWCMFYRVTGAQPRLPGKTMRQSNHQRLKEVVDAGEIPGLIGYRGTQPVGWVSLGPRSDFKKLERSPVMKPVDDTPVWSVICFVVPNEFRGQGVATALLKGALGYARKQGARLIEAYPVDKAKRSRDDSLWFGTKSMYDGLGFQEVARRKPQRPIVRRKLA
jgi:ribosomal protein S18 acetylase RimI-like enzyme